MSHQNAGAIPSLTTQRGFGAPSVSSSPSADRSSQSRPTDTASTNAGAAGAAEAQVAQMVGRVNGGVDLGSSTPAQGVQARGGTAASVGLPGGLGNTGMVGVQTAVTAGGAEGEFSGISASSLQNVSSPNNIVSNGLDTANAQVTQKLSASQTAGQQVEDTEEKKGGGKAGGKRKGGGKGAAGDDTDDDATLGYADASANAQASSRTQNLVNGANAVIASREAAKVSGEPQHLDVAATELPGNAAESEFEGSEKPAGGSAESTSSGGKGKSSSGGSSKSSGASGSSGAASLAQAALQSSEMGEAVSNG